MVTWWRENNVTLVDLLEQSPSDFSADFEYMDQVFWTSAAKIYSNATMENTPIGLLPITHPNFTQIIKAVVQREPNTTFRYFDDPAITNGTFSLYGDPDEIEGFNGGRCPGTNGATGEQLGLVNTVGFVLDGVGQCSVGVVGILGNLVAMLVLSKAKKLTSVFNRLLTCLLVIHTLYIANSLTLQVYKSVRGLLFDLLFSNFLYPSKSMLLYTSTFLTVLMARERYAAVRRPIEYRNAMIGGKPWRTALKHTCVCLFASTLFVIPLVFESEVRRKEIRSVKSWNSTHTLEKIIEHDIVSVTDFRVDHYYVFWYKNFANFLFTVLIPLSLLAYWNLNTVRLMKRRSADLNNFMLRPITPTNNNNNNNNSQSNSQPEESTNGGLRRQGSSISSATTTQQLQTIKAEEEGKARILFVIIVLFFVCNTLRFIIIFEECLSNRDHKFAEENNCIAIPFWVLLTNRVSQFLLTVNASLGSVVYCVMSSDFRRELIRQIRRGKASSKRTCLILLRLPHNNDSPRSRGTLRDTVIEQEVPTGTGLRRLLPRGAIIRSSTRRKPFPCPSLMATTPVIRPSAESTNSQSESCDPLSSIVTTASSPRDSAIGRVQQQQHHPDECPMLSTSELVEVRRNISNGYAVDAEKRLGEEVQIVVKEYC